MDYLGWWVNKIVVVVVASPMGLTSSWPLWAHDFVWDTLEIQLSSQPMQRQLINARMELPNPVIAQRLRLSFILLTVAVATHLSLTGCGSIRVPARGLNPKPHGCKASALPRESSNFTAYAFYRLLVLFLEWLQCIVRASIFY